MTLFWVVAGIFIVAALLFILPTLLRNRGSDTSVARDSTNVSIYQDQISELDNDLRNDVLNQEQYNQSKYELQQRMILDMSEESSISVAKINSKRSIATPVALVLLIPVLAISLYLLLGNTKALLPQPAAEQMELVDGALTSEDDGHQEISSMVDNLVKRLEQEPDDIEGWNMLGRTYAIMGRFNEARDIYAKLLAKSPDSPEALVNYADVFAMTQDGSLMGKPVELINKALSIDPKNPKALALAGTAKFEQGEFKQAAVYWEELLAFIPAESKLAQSVSGSIRQAKSLASNNQGNVLITKQQPPKSDKNVVNKSLSPTISGVVNISPALSAKTSPRDTLYIYARAKSGPKMPLAIIRLQAKDLPAKFTLKDGMGMNPNMKLTSFPEVVISARVTKSGNAVPENGDLQGFSEVIRIGDQDVNILIDRQVGGNVPVQGVKKDSSPPTISGVVNISPALSAKTSPGDTLYIYARAKSGPRMPLAIVRLQAKDLPAKFTLKDGMGMNPNMKLTSFPEVVVSARVTKSGKAVPASGDLQGFSEVVRIGDQNVNILINQQVP
jgi:cytochrome c-type biogenesis protein CcmH